MATRGKSLPGTGRSHEFLTGFFLFQFFFFASRFSTHQKGFAKDSCSFSWMSQSHQNRLVRANLNLYIITFVWTNYRSVSGSLWPCLVPCRPSARRCSRLPRIIVVSLLGCQQIGKCKQPKSQLSFFYLRSFGFTRICLTSWVKVWKC